MVDSAGEDKMVWMNLRNNTFLVKYLYGTLELEEYERNLDVSGAF